MAPDQYVSLERTIGGDSAAQWGEYGTKDEIKKQLARVREGRLKFPSTDPVTWRERPMEVRAKLRRLRKGRYILCVWTRPLLGAA